MDLHFTTEIFKEGEQYVARSPELDLSSCAPTETKARDNLIEAVRLFLAEAGKMGTLDQLLQESGYVRRGSGVWQAPEIVSRQRASVPLPLVHAKT